MIEIAPMHKSDLAAVLEIERAGHIEPWREEMFLEEFDRTHSYLFVARISESAGAIAGYVCCWKVLDEIHILNLAVHTSYRRQGIGRALLLHALQLGCSRGGRIALLEVRQSNIAARQLYESIGFRITGERPNYYGVMPEPAILMQLDMDQEWRARWLGVCTPCCA